jgi:hypothetical protein
MRVRARTRVQSLNNAMPRARDKVQGRETRSKVATRFWYKGWSSTFSNLFSGMYRGVYILYEILKWKARQSINFTACAKDWGLAWKSNLQNYHIRLISPVWLSHDLCNISESPGRSGKMMWPRYFDIPTCRCPRQLFYQTVKLPQCHMVPNWGLQCSQDVGRR